MQKIKVVSLRLSYPKESKMSKYLIFLLLFSGQILASTEQEMQSLMNQYLYALSTKDSAELEKICSKKFISQLQKKGYLKKAFDRQKKAAKKKFQFDLTMQKAARTPNQFFVNIKDKRSLEYSDYWYLIKKEGTRYRINDMVSMD